MRHRLILLSFLVASTGSAQAPEPERPLTEDGCVVVALDSVTRSDSLSFKVKDLANPIIMETSLEGHDLVEIWFTLVSTKAGHVGLPLHDLRDPSSPTSNRLIDSDGKEWREAGTRSSYLEGQKGIRGELFNGARIRVWFIASKAATPKTLRWVYAHWDFPETGEVQHGEIEIDLRKLAEPPPDLAPEN
jgi:hypothetical protein